MSWLSAAARELFGLFVDDVPFTAVLLLWLATASFGLPQLRLDATWDAPLLAAGCALVLIVSARLAARRHRRQAEADR